MRDKPVSKRSINFKRRIMWLLIILVSMLLYIPINRWVHGGVTLALSLDHSIPLSPPFIVPYLLGSLLFVALPVWAAWRVKPGEFESYVLCILSAVIISCIIYIVYPTYVDRPDITAQDFFSRSIALLYQADRVNNAAPSGHTFYSVLSVIYLFRWKPRLAWLWIITAMLIVVSTLLTRQHNILDLVSGLALAILVYFAVRYIRQKWTANFAS